MRTIEVPEEARACILDILSRRRESGGNIARKMMGAGLLPNKPESYVLVANSLYSLLEDGLVRRAGNGKSHQWSLTKKVTP